jgi:SOS-response transcriptional repressor LexA
MSDHLVRVGNLKAHQKTMAWTDSELARQLGKSPQQVRSWYSGDRNIGERLARAIEERLALARYALDDRSQHATTGVVTSGTGRASGVTKSVMEVPVLVWTDVHKMLNVENTALRQKAPHLETFAVCSPRAKFLEMPDDSMAPDISPGDHLLIDPTEAPRAGDVVLVRLPSGEHFVRVFRPRTAYVFEAEALNRDYQPLSSKDDVATVVGVMVEHRRYRRRF